MLAQGKSRYYKTLVKIWIESYQDSSMVRQVLAMMDIQNRITEVRKIRLGDIQPNDHNPRKHPDEQRAAYRGILSAIGWAGVPLVYNSERQGGLTFLDGHMRQDESPDLEADIAVTDLTDDEADLFMLTYDPIGALAQMDGAEIEKLVASSKAIENAGYNVDEILDTFDYVIDVPDFQPVDESEQPRLDQKKPVICPECGNEFVAN